MTKAEATAAAKRLRKTWHGVKVERDFNHGYVVTAAPSADSETRIAFTNPNVQS